GVQADSHRAPPRRPPHPCRDVLPEHPRPDCYLLDQRGPDAFPERDHPRQLNSHCDPASLWTGSHHRERPSLGSVRRREGREQRGRPNRAQGRFWPLHLRHKNQVRGMQSMRHRLATILILCLVSFVLCPSPIRAAAASTRTDEKGGSFITLFNGKDLAGTVRRPPIRGSSLPSVATRRPSSLPGMRRT